MHKKPVLHVDLTARDVIRFRKFLKRNETTGCLEWTGYKNTSGYGGFTIGKRNGIRKRMYLAHRIAWIIAGNAITESLPHVLHDCPCGDNPSCCEVSHLKIGSHQDNMRDIVKKNQGRTSKNGRLPGVDLLPNGRFRARIAIRGRSTHLGVYDTEQEAAEIVREAKEVMHT